MARAQVSRHWTLASRSQPGSQNWDPSLANPSDLVSAHTTRLDSFWLEQNFLNSMVRLRAGQLAGLDFYGNQEYGGSWLIEPMGYAFGNLFSQFMSLSIPLARRGQRCASRPNGTSTLRA